MIPIFVYTKVLSATGSWAEISEQRVFKTLKEAQIQMHKEIDSILDNNTERWEVDYESGDEAHLTEIVSEAEIVISIMEAAIY